jgi:predicted ATPase
VADLQARLQAAVGDEYRIERELGGGGMSRLFLATEASLDRQVVIKLLPPEFANEVSAARFKQEIELAARLQHPNILPVLTTGAKGDLLFYVTPFVSGESLRHRLTREGKLPVTDAVRLLQEIADALAHAHAEGVIHRDIKPENILLLGSHAVLMDFGVARALTESRSGGRLTETGISVGTPAYMSPEQAAGERHIDARSDVYALGVVGYEMLAGAPPFAGPTAQSRIVAHLTETPKPLQDRRPDTPPEVAHAIAQALTKDPNARLRTAAEFRDAIGALATAAAGRQGHPLRVTGFYVLASVAVLGVAYFLTIQHGLLSWVIAGAAVLLLVSLPIVVAAGLAKRRRAVLRAVAAGVRPGPSITLVKHDSVGREKERAELRAGFESAEMGSGLLMCVAGEPGIGKTTLVENFLAELNATDRSCYVARGRCSERLAGSEAYLPFLDALENLVSEAGVDVARLVKRIAPAWYVHVAPLSRDDAPTAPPPADVKPASQERMKRELSALLQELSRFRPLVLFFDDLHWADASTVDLLSYLGTKLDSMHLLMVVTYRPTDLLLAKHPFLQAKLDLQAHGVCREMPLEFLTRGDIEAYLALEFPEHRFPAQFAALIHAKTEGNPLFVVDVLRYLRGRRVLTEEEGRWALAQTVPEIERELPESVRSMIQRKTDQLSDADRRLLIAASVQGYEFDSAVVAKVLGLDAARVEGRLETLERVHSFVRTIGEAEFPDFTLARRYRFVHVLYQNAFYASLTPTRRSSVSTGVAEALLGYYGEHDSQVVAQLAFLFEVAREFGRASHYFSLAAKYAAQVSAHREAVALAHHGLDLLQKLPASPQRDRQELDLLKIQGSSLFVLKGYAATEVEEIYKRAQALCRAFHDPAELFGVLRGLWLHYVVRGHNQSACELMEELLTIGRNTQQPELLVMASHAAGVTLLFQGAFLQAREHLERGIAMYDPQRHSSLPSRYGGYDLAVGCRIFLALVLWFLGYPDQSLRTIEEAVARAKQLNHPYSLAAAYFFSAWIHIDRCEPRLTQDCADACMKLSDEEGFVFQSAHGKVVQGWALAAQGFLQEGLARIRHGIEEYGATGAETERPHLLALLADAYEKAGQTQDGLSALEEALAAVNKTGLRFNQAELYRLKGVLLLAHSSENAAEAEVFFHKAIDIAKRQNARSLQLRAVISLSRLYQRQGKKEDAGHILTEVYGWFTDGFGTADLSEARGLLEALS